MTHRGLFISGLGLTRQIWRNNPLPFGTYQKTDYLCDANTARACRKCISNAADSLKTMGKAAFQKQPI